MNKSRYLKLNWFSIFSIFMLFVLGGLVRSTGSGMGCPDWPKCFGEYVPPTSVSELPDDYENAYKEQRIKKSKRFVSLLRAVGLTQQAEDIENSPQIQESHEFNVTKAYVEYVNRLWGALTGIVVFICFLLSFIYLRSQVTVFLYTTIGFIAVFVNAFLGAVVVQSNLLGGIVTSHFIVAFVSISAFILARRYAIKQPSEVYSKEIKITIIILLFLSIIQVLIGANLRSFYDLLAVSSWSEKLQELYPNLQIHAILGVLIAAVSLYQFIKANKSSSLHLYMRYIVLLAIAQLVFGPLALIDSLASISKLFHISIGAGIFVLQFYICTLIIDTNKKARTY